MEAEAAEHRAEKTQLKHDDGKEPEQHKHSGLPVRRALTCRRVDRHPAWKRCGKPHQFLAFDELLGLFEQLGALWCGHPILKMLRSVVSQERCPMTVTR